MTQVVFKSETPQEVRNIIENGINTRSRYRIWYGDKVSGRSWNEENDICGYFGKSTGGKNAIPLLINNSRSMGGGGLLDNCIIKIVNTSTKQVLYKHPTFNQPIFVPSETDEGLEVKADGEVHARGFKTPQAAERYCAFMNGDRMSK